MLRAAGIEVTTGVMEHEAKAVNAGFLSRVTRRRPHLTLKLALSLDGRIATASRLRSNSMRVVSAKRSSARSARLVAVES